LDGLERLEEPPGATVLINRGIFTPASNTDQRKPHCSNLSEEETPNQITKMMPHKEAM